MLILSADTSGKHGSLALVRCEPGSITPIELVALQGGTFSAQMIPQIAGLLAKHNFRKSEIEAFTVASGPGSFTGLRVGLAAIKALAEILGKPIAAVSLLQATAQDWILAAQNTAEASAKPAGWSADAVNRGMRLLIALDPGRNEVYAGEYGPGPEFPACISEQLLAIDELARLAIQVDEDVLTPDENVLEKLLAQIGGSGLRVHRVPRPDAISIARVGHRKILAGESVSAMALDANYIRRADAEIKTLAPTGSR